MRGLRAYGTTFTWLSTQCGLQKRAAKMVEPTTWSTGDSRATHYLFGSGIAEEKVDEETTTTHVLGQTDGHTTHGCGGRDHRAGGADRGANDD